MAFSYVVDGAIVVERASLPASARRLSDDAWVMGLATASVADQESCGYFIITEVAKPADQAGKAWEDHVELVAGRPTQVWVQRDFTPEETAADTASTNSQTLRDRARTALTTNENFLAIASPTNAQNAAQIKALTRQASGLIRLALRELDSIAGT